MKLLALRDLYHLFVIVLVQITAWLPATRVKPWLVALIASVAHRVQVRKRHLAEANLASAIDGNLDESERERIVRQSFQVVWEEIFSLLPSATEWETVQDSIRVEGLEHLRGALSDGRGAILWESHFGKRLLAKRALHQMGFRLCQIHHERHLGALFPGHGPMTWVRLHVVKRLFSRWEKQFLKDTIYLPTSGSLAFTRTLLRRLQENVVLCSAADGHYGQRPMLVQFLGQVEPFQPGMLSLAKLSGSPILPMFCFRHSDGTMRLVIEGPIQTETDSDRERGLREALTRYVHLLESYVRQYPGQYRNWHFVGKAVRRSTRTDWATPRRMQGSR
jgi:lauroyl/myristoyl acyltransferase